MADVESNPYRPYECIRKRVLPDGWFGLGSFALKLFSQRKNWTDARQYCKSLGGELVSILSSYKNDFVYHILAKPLINTVNRNKSSGLAQPTDTYWALDGHDKDVMLHGPESTYENKDGETALYLSQTSFAQVPAVPFNPEGFTVAFWVYIRNLPKTNENTLFADLPSVGDLTFRINWKQREKQLFFTLYTPEQNEFVHITTNKYLIRRNIWQHIAITWNKTANKGQIVLHGNPLRGTQYTNPSSTAKVSSRSHYELGSQNQVSGSGKYRFHGYVKHLMMFDRTLSVDKIQHVINWSEYGPWIGLSDKTDDKMFVWSDGSPIGQYVPLPFYQASIPSITTSCVAMKKNGKGMNKKCNEKRPFVCQKPIE